MDVIFWGVGERWEMKCLKCDNNIPDDSVFCPRCGGDLKSAVFSEIMEKNNNKPIITIILGIVAVVFIVLSTVLFIDDIRLRGKQDNIIADNTNTIQELNDIISNKTVELSEATDEAKRWEKSYYSIRNTLDTTDNNNAKMKIALDYVVFIGVDDYYYHKWDCEWLDMSEFYAFNTEYAISEGYTPCPHCID